MFVHVLPSQHLSCNINNTIFSCLCSGFPSESVVTAYTNPAVDDSEEAFSWTLPDIDLLREYPLFTHHIQRQYKMFVAKVPIFDTLDE